MPEVMNSSNMNEINDAMNFEIELFKSKQTTTTQKDEKKKKQNLGVLFKKFFNLKLMAQKALKKKPRGRLFEEERLKSWDEMTKKEYKDFHNSDRISKYKLSKIIPAEVSQKR